MTNRFESLYRHLGLLLALVVGITALLVVPFLAMAPTETASGEPGGEVFDARDRIDETFVSSVHAAFYIVEQADGNLLAAAPLAELYDAQVGLREDPEIGPNLFRYFDADAGIEVNGLVNLVDLVHQDLQTQGIGSIADATDDQVQDAGARIIERYGADSDLLGLSVQSTVDANGDWVVPALRFLVLSDDTVLGFGNTSIALGEDTAVEEYDRDVRDLLRTADGFEVQGAGIDVNLTAAEQGAVAGPFIGFTILAVLLLVGLMFRSYWTLATVSVAFLFLLVWLKGISNLIGLKDDLVLSLIVPVAMISFGVDFAFHSIGRYREERATGAVSAQAVIAGLGSVSGALVLALATDTSAFLSNLTSGIESINQFGIGASIALTSAYLLLGVVAPLVVARIESEAPVPRPGRGWLRVAGASFAAAMSMVTVLLLVYVLPWLGVVVGATTAVVVLIIPYQVQRRKVEGPRVGAEIISQDDGGISRWVGGVIARLAGRPVPVLVLATLVTGAAVALAVQVPAEFDVEDFFASDTDFVTGLNQVETHVGDLGGEPALIFVEGDITDPENLARLRDRVGEIRELEVDSLARDSSGTLISAGVLDVIDAAWDSDLMTGLVEQQTGVRLTDENSDTIPDSPEQMNALLDVAERMGVPYDPTHLVMTPDDVATSVSRDGAGSTVLRLSLVNSRAQSSVREASDVLTPVADAIGDDFGGTFVRVTGSPFIREASLDATSRALQISLPVAVVLCLIIGTVFLRSWRYGLASILPIIMVTAWLYAFMYLAGYAINMVTATIAAVSIGIGIDFAIHFISRYREELALSGIRSEAVRAAGEGTGMALVASAVSSSVGFGLLAFAPMPLFAAYGLLTAIMIAMALVATLGVLPSLLLLITKDADEAV